MVLSEKEREIFAKFNTYAAVTDVLLVAMMVWATWLFGWQGLVLFILTACVATLGTIFEMLALGGRIKARDEQEPEEE